MYADDLTVEDVTPEVPAGGGAAIRVDLTVELSLAAGDRLDTAGRRLLAGDTIDMFGATLGGGSWADALGGLLAQSDAFAGIGSVTAAANPDTFRRLTPPVDYAAGNIVSLASGVRMMLEGLADTEDALGRLGAQLTDGLLREAGLDEEAGLAQVQALSSAYGVLYDEALASVQAQLVRPPSPPSAQAASCYPSPQARRDSRHRRPEAADAR